MLATHWKPHHMILLNVPGKQHVTAKTSRQRKFSRTPSKKIQSRIISKGLSFPAWWNSHYQRYTVQIPIQTTKEYFQLYRSLHQKLSFQPEKLYQMGEFVYSWLLFLPKCQTYTTIYLRQVLIGSKLIAQTLQPVMSSLVFMDIATFSHNWWHVPCTFWLSVNRVVEISLGYTSLICRIMWIEKVKDTKI